MCGISGALARGPNGVVTRSLLDAMNDALAHRGPDGEGTWIAEDGAVGLAHRRLAILDLAPNAGQPMRSGDGRLAVTFNGEIYNHAALRAELAAKGARFRTDHADTEVLIHGYAAWGLPGLLARLDGMFAFALWDAAERRLFLARDRLGIKPLYVARTGAMLRFASEIKALVADPAMPREVEAAALSSYLTFLVAPAPLTLFRGITKLPAAHFAVVDAGGAFRTERYWDAPPTDADPGDPVAGVRTRLEAAVARQRLADVPVGLMLSGGVDSSALAALMTTGGGSRLKTFTVGFAGNYEHNEFEAAREVAAEYGTDHHEVRIGESDAIGLLDRLAYQQDEPLADWVCLPLFFVAGLAREAGIKSVLVGEGADELFAGYPGYLTYLDFEAKYARGLRRLPPGVVALLAATARAARQRSRKAEAYCDILDRVAHRRALFWGGAIGFWPSALRDIYRPARDDDAGAIIEEILRPLTGGETLSRMIYTELKLRLPELLLMRVDRMTMAHGVEARVPYLDHALVEYAMRIPARDKVSGHEPKHVLKAALRGLVPDWVLDRPKVGFGAPVADWLKGEFGRVAREAVARCRLFDGPEFDRTAIDRLFEIHRSGRRDRSVQLWTLTNLALWHARWIAA
jgi:asparagine synthase (glutamine-hydrolysing)